MIGPERENETGPRRLLAAALGAGAAVCLLVSLLFPYWQVRLFAPQYPHGLGIQVYAFKAAGAKPNDLGQIDLLNHYIGMRDLTSMAVWERRIALPGIGLLALACLAAPWFKGPRRRLACSLPVLAFPAVFVVDLKYWLRYAVTHLDPTAPLKLPPFSIPLYGTAKIAQFRNQLEPATGFYLAVAACALTLLALLSRRGSAGRARSSGALALLGALVALSFASPARCGQNLQDMVSGARPGAVVDLPAGRYDGPLLIERPLTLRGHGDAVIAGPGQGTVVTIKAPGVTLEGLTIQGSGDSLTLEDSGVRVEAASATVRRCLFRDVLFGAFLVNATGADIEGNSLRGKDLPLGMRGDLIRSWNSRRVTIKDNDIAGGRDVVLWFSTGSLVVGNTVRRGRYGLHFMFTHGTRVAGNTFSGNSVGLYLMYSNDDVVEDNRFIGQSGPIGTGLGLKESDSLTVARNVFLGDHQALYVDDSPSDSSRRDVFSRNLFAYNDIGLSALPGLKGDVFTENSFVDNLQQVSLHGEGGELSGVAWSAGGNGNFWSDYAGYGPAGSSVGVRPYRLVSVFGRLADQMPALRFFAFTPASASLDLAAKAFPIFSPRPILTDPQPLLRTHTRPLPPAPPNKAAMMFAGLLGFSSLAFPLAGMKEKRRRRRRGGPAPAAPEGLPAIKARGVEKAYGRRPVLRGFSLEAAPGECVVLWGPNGAGKSTFLRCLLGLEDFEGRIDVFGLDVVRNGLEARRHVGYVAQEFAGYDWSVQEAMEFVCAARDIDAERISGVLKSCGLEGEERKAVPALSGGLKQRLALAQALVGDPPVLILDEPCSSLDLKSRRDFLSLLGRLKARKTVLVTSHRLEEAELLADRVVLMAEGKEPREVAPDALSSEVAPAGRRLRLRLEAPERVSHALAALEGHGFAATACERGGALWVVPNGGEMLEPVRLLEAFGIRVREIGREAEGA